MSRKYLAGLAACALVAPLPAAAQQAHEDWQTIDVLTTSKVPVLVVR